MQVMCVCWGSYKYTHDGYKIFKTYFTVFAKDCSAEGESGE